VFIGLIVLGSLEDILLLATSHRDDAIRYDCLQVICSVRKVTEPILDIELEILYSWLISNLKVCLPVFFDAFCAFTL
jgi:hypothetical protein